MRRLTKRAWRNTAIGAAVVVAVPTGLVGTAAQATTAAPTYTACLGSAGALYNVVQSPTAPRACRTGDRRVTWNQAGPQGPQGARGLPGARGPQGASGTQGAQGQQGAQGADGPQGADGVNGVNGTDGAQGAQGLQGAQGADGVNGVNGVNGTDGAPGSQGAQGATGAQGPQGAAGPSNLRASGYVQLFSSGLTVTLVEGGGMAVEMTCGDVPSSSGVLPLATIRFVARGTTKANVAADSDDGHREAVVDAAHPLILDEASAGSDPAANERDHGYFDAEAITSASNTASSFNGQFFAFAQQSPSICLASAFAVVMP